MFSAKIGKGVLEITENDFKTMWPKASFVGDFPGKCGACGSDDIAPMHKTPKDFEYFGLKCKDCGAQLTFHQLQKGGFYIKADDEWTKFGEQQQAKPQGNKVFEDDDLDSKIPF